MACSKVFDKSDDIPSIWGNVNLMNPPLNNDFEEMDQDPGFESSPDSPDSPDPPDSSRSESPALSADLFLDLPDETVISKLPISAYFHEQDGIKSTRKCFFSTI
jgi:hypothetical protein